MRYLKLLEKSKHFWFLLSTGLVFFLLRLPSLIEPNWYGDEGIYEVLGLGIFQGRLLYSGVWDNKPPLLYLVYALFGGDQFGARFASLIAGLVSVALFYFLAQKIFRNFKASALSTILFVLLFATPLIEGNIANAENFMLPLAIGAGLLIYKAAGGDHQKKHKFLILLSAGLLLGISFLFKIVGLFDFAAFFIFLMIATLPEEITWKISDLKKIAKDQLPGLLVLASGFILPLVFTVLYFVAQGTLKDFVGATFFGNIGYVGYKNKLIIPQGFLILKLLLLTSVVLLCFWKRKTFSKRTMFILLWLVFSLFNAFFSQRPYTHYVLVVIPALSLLCGVFLLRMSRKARLTFLALLIIVVILITKNFGLYSKKTVPYYINVASYLTGQKSTLAYRTFFDRKTPRDYELASFIDNHTRKEDNVFIWGDSAQIYSLSGKLPPNKYTVAYHIRQSKNGIKDTEEAINKVKPKFVIALDEAPPLPFTLSLYSERYRLSGATIYERIY